MFEEEFKTELLTFLSKDDVELVVEDVTSIINKFPLDAPKKKNYLNILLNVFLRYRINLMNEVSEIVKLPLLEIGSNPKEIVLKQNRTKINFLEFKNIDKFFVKSDLTNLDKFFREISFNLGTSARAIDFSKNSREQRMSHEINNFAEQIFDLEGFFYTYVDANLETDNDTYYLPDRKKNDEVLEKLQDMIRFYAWGRSSLAWSEYLSSDREIQSLADNYQSLQWFYDGYYKRSTPFNVHSPKRYGQYLDTIKSGEQTKKRVSEVFEFTDTIIEKIKDIYSLLNNSPFAVQKENKSNIFELFKEIINLQNILIEKDSLSLDKIVTLFNTLKGIFTDLNFSLEEFYSLNADNVIESILISVVKQIANKELPVEFPYTLIWQSKNKDLIDEYIKKYSIDLEGPNLQMFEFLIEYNHGGISKENFANYFNKQQKISALQDKLLEIGDLPDYDIVKFEDTNYLLEKDENYDFIDFKKLNDLENNIRQALNNLKRIWVHEICGDPIFINDSSFKKYFPLQLGKEKIEYVSELETYLEKWNSYKESSNVIKKLQETISIVSNIKFKLEGEQLVTSDYPGAISLVKAQKVVSRESNRLLLKLKDLIISVAKFKYNEGLNQVNTQVITKSETEIIKQSLQIIDQISSLKDDLKGIDILSLGQELNVFSGFMSSLLGSDAKSTQLKKFSDTLQARYEKMVNDSVIINTGNYFLNINDSITSIVSLLKSFDESLQKFYSNSLEKEIFDKMKLITTSHNLETILTEIKSINEQLGKVVENLSATFSDVATYFEVYADIVFQMMQKYSRLISRNDFYSRLDKSRINFYEDEGSVVITDKIKENASVLEKQIFMEKVFSLYTIVSRACGQISFAVNKSFDNLIMTSELKTEKLDRSFDTKKKVNIVTQSVDSFYKYLDSIKLPSRKYIQTIKTTLKNVPEFIKPINPTGKLTAELSSANRLINGLTKNKNSVNFGLLRKLNDSMNKVFTFIDSSVLVYFTDLVSDDKKKQEILSFIKPDGSTSFSRKINTKFSKIKALTSSDLDLLKNNSIEDLINNNQLEIPTVSEQAPVVQKQKPVQKQKAIVKEPEVVVEAQEAIVEEQEAVAEEQEAIVEEQEAVVEEQEAVVEEQEEEFLEPETDQLNEEEETELTFDTEDDTYEPEIDTNVESDDESGDLISEMEKLLNAEPIKKEDDK